MERSVLSSIVRCGARAALAVMAALFNGCGDGPTVPQLTNGGVLLSAAPQNEHLFLSWNRISGADGYEIITSPRTTPLKVPQGTASVIQAVLPGLVNGQQYSVQLSVMRGTAVLQISNTAVGIPRARGDCTWSRYVPWDRRQSAFCTFEALDAWLRASGVQPAALRCQGAGVTRWDVTARDCLYQTPSGDQLLLMRSADSVFTPDRAYRNPELVREVARRLFWPTDDPFNNAALLERVAISPSTGNVKNHASAVSFSVQIRAGLASRVTWFKPAVPVAGRYAIYHEGHGSPGVVIGAETIDWLLARGWEVIAMDLPINGLNYGDARPGLELHWDLQQFEGGRAHPITYFFSPVKDVVDRILAAYPSDPDILLIGRSGGGWLSYVYGALDPRIDAAVSVAGGTPMSQRLGATWIGDGLEALELGDYEQVAPDIYTVVRHEDFMLAAGNKGFLAMYNQHDPCCFRVNPGSDFAAWLVQGGGGGKRIEFFLDGSNDQHSISAAGYAVLESFLHATLPPKG